MSDTYKPTEHDGLTKDGQPDKRVAGNAEHSNEFAHGKVDPHEAGKKGGSTSGAGGSSEGEFAHGKVDPHEAGKKGGSS